MKRDHEGKPLYREMTLLALYRDGGSCLLQGLMARQEHQGGDAYGDPEILEHHDERLRPMWIHCDVDTKR